VAVNQFFRQPIREILIARITAFIKQGQDRDRLIRNMVKRLRFVSSRVTAEEKQCDRKKTADDDNVNPDALPGTPLSDRIDIFGALNSLRREFKCPHKN
jgi:uncharacterized protein YggU (UPF0235/DUF167 family)